MANYLSSAKIFWRFTRLFVVITFTSLWTERNLISDDFLPDVPNFVLRVLKGSSIVYPPCSSAILTTLKLTNVFSLTKIKRF